MDSALFDVEFQESEGVKPQRAIIRTMAHILLQDFLQINFVFESQVPGPILLTFDTLSSGSLISVFFLNIFS